MSTNKSNKPELRFKGFSDDWEQRKFEEAFIERREKTEMENEDTLLSCAINGIFLNSELFGHFRGTTTIGYLKVKKNDLILSAQNLHLGNANVNLRFEHGIISPAYKVYDLNNCNPEFVQAWVKKEDTKNFFLAATTEGASQCRKNIEWSTLAKQFIAMPTLQEQSVIGTFFANLDHLITLHQSKCDNLKIIKNSMLDNLFPKNGEKVPKWRFKGFNDDWEQRKFSDLVQIERGGSPRPIDDFITDAPNGLNWVKIGDTPTQGNYITKTTEKIRPEGLPKTREVHPGDLILSNSMSFGKPYIMGIDGCIHDGWLLIRNIYGVFDLTFLCHLLGTSQMLSQYRSLAAGSTVNNLNKELVGNTVVTIPSITEQRLLGDYLEQLDNLITLHQSEVDRLKKVKQFFLKNLFV